MRIVRSLEGSKAPERGTSRPALAKPAPSAGASAARAGAAGAATGTRQSRERNPVAAESEGEE